MLLYVIAFKEISLWSETPDATATGAVWFFASADARRLGSATERIRGADGTTTWLQRGDDNTVTGSGSDRIGPHLTGCDQIAFQPPWNRELHSDWPLTWAWFCGNSSSILQEACGVAESLPVFIGVKCGLSCRFPLLGKVKCESKMCGAVNLPCTWLGTISKAFGPESSRVKFGGTEQSSFCYVASTSEDESLQTSGRHWLQCRRWQTFWRTARSRGWTFCQNTQIWCRPECLDQQLEATSDCRLGPAGTM